MMWETVVTALLGIIAGWAKTAFADNRITKGELYSLFAAIGAYLITMISQEGYMSIDMMTNILAIIGTLAAGTWVGTLIREILDRIEHPEYVVTVKVHEKK